MNYQKHWTSPIFVERCELTVMQCFQCLFHLSVWSSVNNPGYKISIFVVLGKHKAPNVRRMSVRRIRTILTIQSKGDLLDQPSPIPEQIFLFVVISIIPVDTGVGQDTDSPSSGPLIWVTIFLRIPIRRDILTSPFLKRLYGLSLTLKLI